MIQPGKASATAARSGSPTSAKPRALVDGLMRPPARDLMPACPVCRVRAPTSMFAKVGICYVCDSRVDWLHRYPEETRFLLTEEHWARLHAYCGVTDG